MKLLHNEAFMGDDWSLILSHDELGILLSTLILAKYISGKIKDPKHIEFVNQLEQLIINQ